MTFCVETQDEMGQKLRIGPFQSLREGQLFGAALMLAGKSHGEAQVKETTPDAELIDWRIYAPPAEGEKWIYVNVYLEDRAFGGREEGGWWYNYGDPVLEWCKVATSEEEVEALKEAALAWCQEENACRRSDIYSVLSEGRYIVCEQEHPPQAFPETTPFYE